MSDTPERTAGGLAGRIAGKAKETAGSLTGNEELAREGRLQQAASDAQARGRRAQRGGPPGRAGGPAGRGPRPQRAGAQGARERALRRAARGERRARPRARRGGGGGRGRAPREGGGDRARAAGGRGARRRAPGGRRRGRGAAGRRGARAPGPPGRGARRRDRARGGLTWASSTSRARPPDSLKVAKLPLDVAGGVLGRRSAGRRRARARRGDASAAPRRRPRSPRRSASGARRPPAGAGRRPRRASAPRRSRPRRSRRPRERRAAAAEKRRKQASEKAAAQREEAIEAKAKRDELEALEAEKAALDEREKALDDRRRGGAARGGRRARQGQAQGLAHPRSLALGGAVGVGTRRRRSPPMPVGLPRVNRAGHPEAQTSRTTSDEEYRLTAPAAAPRGRKAHDVETDAARLRRYGAERRPEDREWLVERYLPLARHVAARYSGGSEPIEDLQQVASLGLVKAIDRFDAVARRELLQLRRADDRRRAAALLPRPHVVAAGPARRAGAGREDRQGRVGAAAGPRPRADRRRARRTAWTAPSSSCWRRATPPARTA